MNSKTLLIDLKTIGKRLHDIRKASGLSQEEVAIKAGISGRTYAAIERGGTNPRLDTIIKICDTLGAFPDDIMTIDNSRNPDCSVSMTSVTNNMTTELSQKEKYSVNDRKGKKISLR